MIGFRTCGLFYTYRYVFIISLIKSSSDKRNRDICGVGSGYYLGNLATVLRVVNVR